MEGLFQQPVRDHDEAAAQYGELKHALARAMTADDADARERYAAAKGSFIERIVALARLQGYPRL